MGRFRSGGLQLAVAILSFCSINGCGGGTKAGPPIFPGIITLTPGGSTSVELGGFVLFSASARTASGTNISTTFTFSSSDTSVLNVAPNGVACAGHWDAAFTSCTPSGTGVVQVTALALGAASTPTYVFVHPPIDNISVTGVLLNGIPIQEPCLSQSQSMTVEAHAYSQGSDITASVGPFTWSARDASVANITPLVNTAYNFPTNQATATAVTPGMTEIYASTNGVTSTSFQQPQYQNSQGTTSPALDFFETCPIQNVALELGTAGSLQTSFVATKGISASETVVATVTDVMGNSSLPNTNGGVVLSKIPLTWTSSQPGAVGPAAGCTQSCVLNTPSPGAATVTASCSPPTCNIGFPLVPASLSSPAALATCTQFFQAQAPSNFSCQQLIPSPVYASNAIVVPPTVDIPLLGNGEISALVTGAPAASSLLATSAGCAHQSPLLCTTGVYNVSTSKAAPGAANAIPVSPNSLIFDLGGDKAYMGSDFGAEVINPANLGSSTSAFTSLGTVTGNVLAVSPNGNVAVFSDTLHSPNQVYVVNTTSGGAPTAALSISAAVAAAFSPDGLKAFIFGNGGGSLYIDSSLQGLQGPIALAGPANAVAFSPNGAFAYAAEAAANGNSANVTAFATCNNQVAASVNLPANPLFMKVLPAFHINGTDSYGNAIPDGIHILVLDATGFDIITSTISQPASGTLCPQGVSLSDLLHPVRRIELGQGTIQPVNFFASADGTQLYVLVAGNSTILVYDFSTGSVTGGIELLGNATPISADISVDSGTIVVAGSDGMLHEVSAALGGADLFQIPFPNLPNYLNPFCTYTPAQGPCTLNLVAVKP